MIENIRKYNILIIVGLVVVGAALVIGLNTSNMRGPGGQPYIKIGARTYSDVEYRQLGISGQEIVSNLAQSNDFQLMYQFLFSLAPNSMFSPAPSASTEQFFINRMLIRQARDEFGIHPSDEEISEFTRNMASFRGADREFNPEMYARFIDKGIGRMGLTERDFRELIADIITTRQIQGIVSGGLTANREATAKRMALDTQRISGSVARLALAPFKESLDPTDEELRSYWELIQDAFTTEEQRRFSYILVAPEAMPGEPSADQPRDTASSIAEAAMSDEAKAEAERKKAEEEAAKEAELAEMRRDLQRQLDAKVDDFTYVLEGQMGEGFEELAAKEPYQWEVGHTELFTSATPPEALNLSLRSSGRGGSAVSQLFRITPTSDPLSKISQPMAVGENQWLVARLDEVVASRPKTFEEAREQVRRQYIDEKALEALDKAIKEAAAKVGTALGEGKSFAEASTAAGLTEVEPFDQVDSQYRPLPPAQPTNLFQAARTVDPGTLAEPLVQGAQAYIIHVAQREVVREENQEQLLDGELNIEANQNAMAAFSGWLASRAESALIERYYRRQ